jgi:hypothetical protein
MHTSPPLSERLPLITTNACSSENLSEEISTDVAAVRIRQADHRRAPSHRFVTSDGEWTVESKLM